jgi:glycosyltransferase involved in cell wall biosynthesis
VKLSIVILTYNSESSLEHTLHSVISLSDDVHVIDSFSSDRTVEIALDHGAKVATHAFENYGVQRNWAISSLPFTHRWQLHLDADERVTPELREELMNLEEPDQVSGFYIPRLMCFLGKPILHGGLFPTWHLRLFRSGFAKCEARKYDQHFYVTAGQTRRLNGFMIDDVRMTIGEWTLRHNRWSDAELEEQSEGADDNRIKGRVTGNPVERKRFWRNSYDHCPLFVRPFALFFYRYIVRFGFLDGYEGFIFYVLQTFWFRFLIDTKLFELKLTRRLAIRQVPPDHYAALEVLNKQIATPQSWKLAPNCAPSKKEGLNED